MAETRKKSKESPRIDIYKAWCKSCGICTAFCPKGVLAKDEEGYPYVKDPEKCINCGWCEMHCPDFAITVEQRKKHENNLPQEEEEEEVGVEEKG